MRALILAVSIGLLAAGCGAAGAGPTQAPVPAAPATTATAAILEMSVGWKGGYSVDDVPKGAIWFGKDADPERFVLTGDPITKTSMAAKIVLMARLDHRVAEGSQLILRTADRSTPFTYGADGDLVSFWLTAGELLAATTGEKTVEIVDAGSNVLATGSLTVTE
jgi:hypothetical protein